MSGRKSTGKRKRFEIFKRDNFTCQYCGAQPPDVVLVCDHITPIALGGSNDLENLITACEPCNQGKAAKPLNEYHPRPDADLMYLEVQQEIAELRKFQAAQKARDAALKEAIEVLQDCFCDLTGYDWAPADSVLRQVLSRYEPWLVQEALLILGRKMLSLEACNQRLSNWVPYFWGVCKKIAKDKGSIEGDD